MAASVSSERPLVPGLPDPLIAFDWKVQYEPLGRITANFEMQPSGTGRHGTFDAAIEAVRESIGRLPEDVPAVGEIRRLNLLNPASGRVVAVMHRDTDGRTTWNYR